MRERFPNARVGIHTHNDSGVADANSLVAVEEGATHVQGTFNGLGERCGNADLTTVIPNLALKMGRKLSIDRDGISGLYHTARLVCALSNRTFPENHPFVGEMAFAHKGGVHVNSVRKVADSYEHLRPEEVGNTRRILISELSGKSNIEHLAEAEGIDLSKTRTRLARRSSRSKTSSTRGTCSKEPKRRRRSSCSGTSESSRSSSSSFVTVPRSSIDEAAERSTRRR